MKAVDSHLLKLLRATNQFIVPIYQRVYSWREAECAQLWADILRAGSNPHLGSHFTGSIVYVAKDKGTNTSAEPDLIIDGQQRVTTVTILLNALAERLEQLPESEREPEDGFSPTKIRNRFLLNADETDERRFKLILSQADRVALMALLQGAKPPSDVVSRVVDNDAWFRGQLADQSLDLVQLCRGLDKLVVVDVTLERGVDHPQLVFEAMNSTGKKLTQADLIRNYVLMDLPPAQQNKIYSAHWRPMELEFASTEASASSTPGTSRRSRLVLTSSPRRQSPSGRGRRFRTRRLSPTPGVGPSPTTRSRTTHICCLPPVERSSINSAAR